MSHAERRKVRVIQLSSRPHFGGGRLVAYLVLLSLALTSCAQHNSRVAISGRQATLQPLSASGAPADASTAPATACQPALQPGLTVVGAFDTSVAGIRQWQAQQVSRDAQRSGQASPSGQSTTWSSEQSATAKAVLCYLDGTINKAPPELPSGTVPEPFDRSVVAVLQDGTVIAVSLGSQKNIPVNAPPP